MSVAQIDSKFVSLLDRKAISKPNSKPIQTKQKLKTTEPTVRKRSATGEPVKVEESQPQFQIKASSPPPSTHTPPRSQDLIYQYRTRLWVQISKWIRIQDMQ